jgi:hypothetical protein
VTGYFDRLDFVYAEVFQVLPTELNAEFATVFAPIDADFATAFAPLLADLTSIFDPASAADIATGLDPSTAIDPAIFADLVSSIAVDRRMVARYAAILAAVVTPMWQNPCG